MTAETIVELESQHTVSEASPRAVLGLSGTALLAACGGGGGDSTSTTPATTPDNSLANNLALTDAARFLRQASWGERAAKSTALLQQANKAGSMPNLVHHRAKHLLGG